MGDGAERTEADQAGTSARPKGSAQRRRAVKEIALATPADAPLHHLAEVEATIERELDAATQIPTAADPADSQAEDSKMDTADNAAQTFANTANDAAERTSAAGQAAAADLNGRAQDAMARGAKLVEEMNDFGKGNVEALVESGRIAAKGVETLGQQAAEYARKSFEDASNAMRTLAGTRSPTEFFRLQGDYTRQMFDAMVAETSKSTEAMLKLANDVAQPLSNRFALAAEKARAAA